MTERVQRAGPRRRRGTLFALVGHPSTECSGQEVRVPVAPLDEMELREDRRDGVAAHGGEVYPAPADRPP
jgi:hypothetical protein